MIEIPGYEIKREIGASKMATVYLALQASLDRDVALKVVAPEFAENAAFSQRFMQEARTLASLAHPHIVAVYDVGQTPDEKQHYFAMQYLPGGDLVARVHGGISEVDLITTLDGIAQALDYVHQRGLIHRDVTPSNILYDESGAPVLTDFGIARAFGNGAGSTGTDFGAVMGHYISPEQARGAALDARADLYSLGALTWFGLTGKPPIDGVDGFAVAYAHVFEPIPRLPPAQARWQPLIDRTLAKDPAQRIGNASEFLQELSKLAQTPRNDSPASGPAPVTEVAPAIDTSATLIAAPIIVPTVAPEAATLIAPIVVPEVAKTVAANVAVVEPSAAVAAVPPAVQVQPAPKRESETGATVQRARPAVLRAASAPAAAPKPDTATSARRWWPLLVLVAGAAVIAFAFYNQFSGQKSLPSATALPPPQTAVQPPAVPAAVAPTTAVTTTPPTNASTTSESNSDQTVPAPVTTDATALPSLDAAAEAAVGEFEPVTDLAKVPTVVEPIPEALRLGRLDLAARRLTTPPGQNALERFQFVLKREPKNKLAKQGIVEIAKKYIEYADKAQASGDQTAAAQFLTNADDVAKSLDEAADTHKDIATRRGKLAEPYLAQARAAAAEWDKATAKTAYEKALGVDPNSTVAREGLKYVESIGQPGFAFRDKLGDAGQGPEMIVLGGKVAVARHDVTRGEFRRFWNAAGRTAFAGKEPACRDRESFFRSSKDRNWQNPGFEQDDSHPVVCISWPEAAAFAQWLSRESGKRYRLLSVGEFDQIAARSGSDCTSANLADASFNRKFDSHDGAGCDDGFAGTSPVGHFEPSGGVFDGSGNVRVWVAACGNGATASSACRDYLAKGRSWMSAPKESPLAKDSFGADVALNSVGLRVAREVEK